MLTERASEGDYMFFSEANLGKGMGNLAVLGAFVQISMVSHVAVLQLTVLAFYIVW
jgi:hypothetical protein